MPSYEHQKIADALGILDRCPEDADEFGKWIEARGHLDLLRANASSDELILYASPGYSFVHAIVVPNEKLFPLDKADLLRWSFNPYNSAASYVSGGGRPGVWIERGPSPTGSRTLDSGIQLVFGRSFEGWTGPGQGYFEISQEFAHLSAVHWRPEQCAYCRFDANGDLDQVISTTGPSGDWEGMSLVTCHSLPLEEYLSAADASVVRMFDFTLLRRGQFPGWESAEEEIVESDEFVYRQRLLAGVAAYTRGVQIIRPKPSRRRSWESSNEGPFVEYIAHDWRNGSVRKISTDPRATTNYFDAENNRLPFELSPAFFRPEVMAKYKTDREKYKIGDRDITCRASWYLKSYDVNEAGQVFAYVCDLRNLPYTEQLHWLSFNEPPKSGISARAVQTDFMGQFAEHVPPLQMVLAIVASWHSAKKKWWQLRSVELPSRVSQPVTSSRDEWADAALDLSKLVVEGFVVDELRRRIAGRGLSFDPNEQSIVLLERLVFTDGQRLDGLRQIQRIRSKVKGHSEGSEASSIVQAAIREHGSLRDHFTDLCREVAAELEMIQKVMGD